MTKKILCVLIFAFGLLGLTAQTSTSPNQGLVMSQVTSTGAMTFSWWGVAGRAYFIEYSSDLVNWSYLPVAESGNNAVIQYGFASTGTNCFLRLTYSDGLTGDPYAFDSDGDGIPDWWEYYNFGHLGVTWAQAAGLLDPANGISEWWEMLHFGHLGVTQAQAFGLNDPANGINEFWELQNFGQLGVTMAQANAIDTDHDGVPDWWEITNDGHLGVYGSASPQITPFSGSNQTGAPGYFLPEPWIVKVTDANGVPLANSPATFSVPPGDTMQLSTANDGSQPLQQTITVLTDSHGLARVYMKL